VGTAHGNRLENLIKNPTLSDLVGGIQSVTLGDEEARRRGSQKSVLERKAPPTFDIAVEMLERQRWVVHEHVAETIDNLLRGRQPNPQVRTVSETGKVMITHELSSAPTDLPTGPSRVQGSFSQFGGSENFFDSRSTLGGRAGTVAGRGWRASGRMRAISSQPQAEPSEEQQQFERLLNESFQNSFDAEEPASEFFSDTVVDDAIEHLDQVEPPFGPNGEDPLYIYPYGVSRHQLDQVIRTLNLPVVLTKDIDHADAVLALRSQVKNHSKLRQLAKVRQVPIHTVKASSIPQIARGLRRMLDMDDPNSPDATDFDLLVRGSNDDEIESLEDARLAVEQIVIPKGQPVELLPRSATIRKMQHELVEHYHLKSRSFGEEPNRRLRIYPA
jgi:hypothetical protein